MSTYGSMPAAPEPAPGVPAAAPSTVRNAVLLMYVRAALGVISIIVLIATKNSLRNQIHKDNPDWSSSKLDSAVNAGIAVGVIVGVIFLVLYILLALQVAKGRNWARIVTWVISALGVLSLLSVLGTSTALEKIINLIGGLAAIGIIVLLAMAPSNQYFANRS
jgi:hypothetical protein